MGTICDLVHDIVDGAQRVQKNSLESILGQRACTVPTSCGINCCRLQDNTCTAEQQINRIVEVEVEVERLVYFLNIVHSTQLS